MEQNRELKTYHTILYISGEVAPGLSMHYQRNIHIMLVKYPKVGLLDFHYARIVLICDL